MRQRLLCQQKLADSFFCLLQQTQMYCCHKALVKNLDVLLKTPGMREKKKKCGTGEKKKKRPLEDTHDCCEA